MEEPGSSATPEQMAEWRLAATAFLQAAKEQDEERIKELQKAQPKRMERIAAFF